MTYKGGSMTEFKERPEAAHSELVEAVRKAAEKAVKRKMQEEALDALVGLELELRRSRRANTRRKHDPA
jgi:hypothetical protein